MDLGEKIMHLAVPLLSDESQFVVGVSVSSLQGPQKVTVILDGDKGVTIDDCSALSRRLSDAMEGQGLIGENFTLEVTTPGIDRPLQLKRQYSKNVGRGLKVYRRDRTFVEGKLTGVTEDEILLDTEAGDGKKTEVRQHLIRFAEIDKALVQISFK